MEKKHLKRAAAFLARTELGQVCGKRITAKTLERDIKALFELQPVEPAILFYKGWVEMIENQCNQGQPLENMLTFLMDRLREKLQELPDDHRRISGFVCGAVAAAKAVIDCVESRGEV